MGWNRTHPLCFCSTCIMKKFIAISIGVLMFSGQMAFATTEHQRLMDVRSSREILESVPMKSVNRFAVVLKFSNNVWADGVHDTDAHRIFIRGGLPFYRLRHVVFHESGHYAHDNWITDREMNLYCSLYDQEGVSPSRYGKMSCRENFAEMFAYILGSRHRMYWGNSDFLTGSDQYKFIEKIVNSQ